MIAPKNYSAVVRAANTHKIINAAQFISILRGDDATYVKHYDWIEIESHIISDFVRLQDFVTAYKVKIKDCYFESHLSLEGAVFEEMVTLDACRFEKGFQIDKCNFNDKFEILGIYITALWISGGSFNEFVVRGYSSDLIRFWIAGGKFKEFTFTRDIHDPILDEFVIYNKGTLEGNINLENILTKKISIHGLNLATNELFFEGVKCDHFVISNLNNKGAIKIFGLEPNSNSNTYFEIIKSNLGKAQFYRVAFLRFTEVNFVDSFLGELNIINCDWGKNFRGIESPDYFAVKRLRPIWSQSEAKQLREFFRQLKFTYDKQGDKINETLFYAHEMNIHNSLLPWKKIWYKPWSETFWEKLIIVGSKYLSNYGMSFLIPLLGMLASNLFILIILIHFFGYKGLDLAGFAVGEKDANTLAIGEFFRIINPVHKFDETLQGWEVFWDLVARISSSYFLYSLLRSSRRFLK